jgi:hypothetical protein
MDKFNVLTRCSPIIIDPSDANSLSTELGRLSCLDRPVVIVMVDEKVVCVQALPLWLDYHNSVGRRGPPGPVRFRRHKLSQGQ